MPGQPEIVTRFVSARAAQVNLDTESRMTGFAIVFNALSQDLGGFRERIAPSAVDRTLRSGKNVDALVDHRRETSTIIGSTDSGLLRLEKQSRGLRVQIDPPDTTAVRDLQKVVQAGLAKGMSFAFWVWPGGEEWDEEDGEIVRTVTDMEFSEVSIVVNPAYLQTTIHARTAELDAAALREFKRSQRFHPSLKFRQRMERAGR
jgi:HK97 family phage prohead protease